MLGAYGAADGEYTTTGTFQALGSYVVHDLPEHGFSTYNGTFDTKITNLTSVCISVIADLGMRLSLGNSWGLYLGLYSSYGLTDMLAEKSDKPMVMINTNNPSELDYNGTFGSDEIDALRLIRAGVKVGIDFGWNCGHEELATTGPELVPVEQPADDGCADRLAAEQAARKKAEVSLDNERSARWRVEKQLAECRMAVDGDNYDPDRYTAIIVPDYLRTKPASDDCKDLLEAEQANRSSIEQAIALEHNARKELEAELASCRKALADRAAQEKARQENAAREMAAADRRAKALALDMLKGRVGRIQINFDFNKTVPLYDVVTDTSLHALCAQMKSDTTIKVVVIGHTDSVGSDQSNIKLGQRRADVVRQLMINLGAPARNIETETRGENAPVESNKTDRGRAQNRRVTLRLK